MLKGSSSIVSCEWLKEHLSHKDLIVLDATIPKVTLKGEQKLTDKRRIPTSRFFDIKGFFSDSEAPFPNTMLSPDNFEKEAQALGINQDSYLVIYDDHGIYSSPRAWMMFKSMGFENVAVLNGGLPLWIEKGYSVEGITQMNFLEGNFESQPIPKIFIGSEEVLNLTNSQEHQVLDARSEARFFGKAPEPRKGVRSGHIPNSKSLPYSTLLSGFELKSKSELKTLYQELNNKNDPMIFSCGTGITACVLALGAEILDYKDYAVYDGSWTEWGSTLDLPIEV